MIEDVFEMSFWTEVSLSAIDNLIFAGVIVGVAAFFNYLLQRHKARDGLFQAIAGKRAEAYAAFWKASEPFRATEPEPLTASDIESALAELNAVYFEAGGAMYLSHPAMIKLAKAKAILKAVKPLDGSNGALSATEQASLQSAFSAFRTQLKQDLLVYSDREARTPIT